MSANDSKSYIGCCNKLVDKYNNTCHRSIDKKLLMLIMLKKKLNRVIKFLTLKLVIESRLLSTRIFLADVTL